MSKSKIIGSVIILANEDDAVTTVVDTETRSVVAQINVGIEPEGMAVSPDGKIAITITDTGPGISPDMVGRLFKPFETGKSAGLGVGLALGRRIVERMGGSLDLRNGAKEGVEVILILPGQV